MTHQATWTAENGEYVVTCPQGCNLGTSAHAGSEQEANRRVELHRIATREFNRKEGE
jgi:hypothetical protein